MRAAQCRPPRRQPIRRRYRRHEAAAVPVRPALLESEDVLEKHRYAGERTRKFSLRRCTGLIKGLKDVGVKLRIVPLDPLYRSLDEFNGFNLFLLHELGKPEAVIVRIFGKTHARLPRAGKDSQWPTAYTVMPLRDWCQSRF